MSPQNRCRAINVTSLNSWLVPSRPGVTQFKARAEAGKMAGGSRNYAGGFPLPRPCAHHLHALATFPASVRA
jgi:hypothetical protein